MNSFSVAEGEVWEPWGMGKIDRLQTQQNSSFNKEDFEEPQQILSALRMILMKNSV